MCTYQRSACTQRTYIRWRQGNAQSGGEWCEWQRRLSGLSGRVLGQPWVTSASACSCRREYGEGQGRAGQGSSAQSSSAQSSSSSVAAVLVLAETLKKLLLFIPKTLPRRLFRPTRALGVLGGPWGREIGSGPYCIVGTGRTNESGCYLDPHGVGMWLDEALDDRRREAIKIRSRPRPLRPGEAADGAVSRL